MRVGVKYKTTLPIDRDAVRAAQTLFDDVPELIDKFLVTIVKYPDASENYVNLHILTEELHALRKKRSDLKSELVFTNSKIEKIKSAVTQLKLKIDKLDDMNAKNLLVSKFNRRAKQLNFIYERIKEDRPTKTIIFKMDKLDMETDEIAIRERIKLAKHNDTYG